MQEKKNTGTKQKMRFKIIKAETQELLRSQRPEAQQAFKRKPYYMQRQTKE